MNMTSKHDKSYIYASTVCINYIRGFLKVAINFFSIAFNCPLIAF